MTFFIASYNDFLSMEQLKALSNDDFKTYADAYVDYTENRLPDELSEEEQQYILTHGELITTMQQIRINDIKIQKINETNAREKRSKQIEPVVWMFVTLCCLSFIGEIGGAFLGFPVPVFPALGACILFGIFAWALSAKL